MLNIFISHIHEEAKLANAIKRRLDDNFGAQVNIFLAEDISLGENWFDHIKERLVSSDLIIAIFSPYSMNRPWVNIEAGYGIMQGKRVIPICAFGLTAEQLPVVYKVYQGITITDPDGIAHLFEQIAALTEAKRMLTDLETAAQSWLQEITHLLPTLTSYPRADPNDAPVVWLIGSHTALDEGHAQKALDAIDTLAKRFVEARFQIVMGTSRMLDYSADQMAFLSQKKHQLANPSRKAITKASAIANETNPVPMPVVLLGSFRSPQGVRRIFKDAIGKIPDVAVLIGGNPEGRTQEEYGRACSADIPVLSLAFTGGAAPTCKSTFDSEFQKDVASIQRLSGKMERLGNEIVLLIIKQTQKRRMARI